MYQVKQAIIICCLLFTAFLANAQQDTATDTVTDAPKVFDPPQAVVDSAAVPLIFEDAYPQTVPYLPAMRDTLQLREVAAVVTDKLKRRREFDYANDPEYWRREEESGNEYQPGLLDKMFLFLSRPAVRSFLMLLLILAGIFFIVRVIIVNKLYIFKAAANNKKPALSSDDAALMEEDLDEKIRESLAAGDHRSVVRFQYLKTLKLLDKKGWISFHPQTTNHTYRNQVNHYARGRDFGFLISAYEYVWYGDFKLNPEQFELVNRNFTHFQSALKV